MLVVRGYVAYTFALGAFSFWGPTFLEKRPRPGFGYRRTVFSARWLWWRGLVGTLAGGFAATAWQKRNRAGYAWVLAGSLLLAVPVVLVALWIDESRCRDGLSGAGNFSLFLDRPSEHAHHRNRSREFAIECNGAFDFHDSLVWRYVVFSHRWKFGGSLEQLATRGADSAAGPSRWWPALVVAGGETVRERTMPRLIVQNHGSGGRRKEQSVDTQSPLQELLPRSEIRSDITVPETWSAQAIWMFGLNRVDASVVVGINGAPGVRSMQHTWPPFALPPEEHRGHGQ